MRKITIVIDNIPESQFEGDWKYAIKKSKQNFGVPIEKTDTIKIDFTDIANRYPSLLLEIYSPMISGALTIHMLNEADKILNS